MSYLDFVKRAYPKSKVTFDQQLTLISRLYRPIGLRIGYLAWRLGLSGNAVTTIRIAMVLIGFFLLTISGRAALGWRLLGFLLMWFSKIMDYADGAVARANNSTSLFGHKFDELSDQPISQGMMLCLIAYYSDYVFLIPYSIFLEFVIHRFGAPLKNRNINKEQNKQKIKKSKFISIIDNYFINKHHDNGKNNLLFFINVNLFCKLFISDFMHLMLIPLFIAIFNEPNTYIWFPLACTILIELYTIIAVIRFIGAARELKM